MQFRTNRQPLKFVHMGKHITSLSDLDLEFPLPLLQVHKLSVEPLDEEDLPQVKPKKAPQKRHHQNGSDRASGHGSRPREGPWPGRQGRLVVFLDAQKLVVLGDPFGAG